MRRDDRFTHTQTLVEILAGLEFGRDFAFLAAPKSRALQLEPKCPSNSPVVVALEYLALVNQLCVSRSADSARVAMAPPSEFAGSRTFGFNA